MRQALRDRSLPEALREFVKRIKDKPPLLDALALPFLQDVQNDMTNKLGHDRGETQSAHAERGRGHKAVEPQIHSAASNTKGGQKTLDAQVGGAALGGGHMRYEARAGFAPALPPVSAARCAAAKRAAKAEVEALDLLRDLRGLVEERG